VDETRVIIIAGVRPQYVKTKAVLWLIERYCPQFLKNTVTFDIGQHYSPELAGKVQADLDLSFDFTLQHPPDATRGEIIGRSIAELSRYFSELSSVPTVVVFGDAASVVAGAFAAYNAEFPLVHIEAGARRDPSEIEHYNSVVVDNLATYRLPYSERAMDQLRQEQLEHNSLVVGDVAYEWYRHRYPEAFATPQRPQSAPVLVSLHRPNNMQSETIETVALELLGTGREVRWLSFPRNRPFLERLESMGVTILPPLPQSSVIDELASAGFVLTDSGGVSREAHYFQCPIIMRRDRGGWPELRDAGFLYSLTGRAAADVRGAVAWAQSVRLPGPSQSPLIRAGGGRAIAELVTSDLRAEVRASSRSGADE
jgi:UDP-N-acetylglucosamine 2-epimerase